MQRSARYGLNSVGCGREIDNFHQSSIIVPFQKFRQNAAKMGYPRFPIKRDFDLRFAI